MKSPFVALPAEELKLESLEPPWAEGEEWKKPARMIVKLLQKPNLGDLSVEGCESVFGCKHIAQQLFTLITTRHGERTARRIFAMWGTPPTTRRLAMIKNFGLLGRLDLMEEPNVQRLARQIAKENEGLPRKDRRGPGSTNPVALEKQIRRIRDLRTAGMKKGTWWGPFPPGHFT
jgi:hypothetical protein